MTLPYRCDKIVEETRNIADSSAVPSDSIVIAFGNSGVSVSSVVAYLKPISIAYVPSSSFYDALEGIVDKPRDIYTPSDDAYLLRNEKTIAPALYLGNQKAYEWESRVSIGDKQQMRILTSTGGQERKYEETRDLIVGSVVSVAIDTQTISPQSLLTGYENYKKMKDSIDSDNFYETGYCDSYLDLIGNAYFARLDIENTIYASAYDIYKERDLSFGLFMYEPNVVTKNVGGYQTATLTKEGHFGLDILGLYNKTVSMTDNDRDVSSYLFVSGYVSSYLEGKILRQFTGIEPVSTAEVFRQCEEQGVGLKIFSSENSSGIDKLQLSADDKEDIMNRAQGGSLIIVPEQNITVNDWTGTAYLTQDRAGTAYEFIITGDKNGGYTTVDLSVFLTVSAIGSGADMYSMIFGMVDVMSFLIATPALGTVVTAAALITVTVVFVKAVETWAADYQETIDLYFQALSGNTDAGDELKGKAAFASVSIMFDFCSAGLEGKRGTGPDDIPKPGKRKEDFSQRGYESEIVDSIFGMRNVDSCSDNLLNAIAKSASPSEVAQTLSKYSDDVIESINKSVDKDAVVDLIAKHGDKAVKTAAKSNAQTLQAIGRLSDDTAGIFLETASKYAEELVPQLNGSSHVGTSIEFITRYSDEGAQLFIRNGDMGVDAISMLEEESINRFFTLVDEYSYEAGEIVDFLHGLNEHSLSEESIRDFLFKEIKDAEEIKILEGKDIYQRVERITVLKPNVQYHAGSSSEHAQYMYKTDEAGRIISVDGDLERFTGKRNSYAQSQAGRGDRITAETQPNDPDEGGHLIATIFNGDGHLDNLVAMNRNLNRGAWESMEKDWASLLEQGYGVNVSIQIKYPNGNVSLRPESFSIRAIVTDPQSGKQLADQITKFNNCRGQKYTKIELKQLYRRIFV